MVLRPPLRVARDLAGRARLERGDALLDRRGCVENSAPQAGARGVSVSRNPLDRPKDPNQ